MLLFVIEAYTYTATGTSITDAPVVWLK